MCISSNPGDTRGEVTADIADTVRINERIRADMVRLIGHEGEQVGIVNLKEALALSPTD